MNAVELVHSTIIRNQNMCMRRKLTLPANVKTHVVGASDIAKANQTCPMGAMNSSENVVTSVQHPYIHTKQITTFIPLTQIAGVKIRVTQVIEDVSDSQHRIHRSHAYLKLF